ncbi:hypothetical protein H1S01_19795 [Heliobacterium chlorum]|uniref:Uncharacterized protein n=1 Tax=Heliobacterium chlorum TaxID=2698 RepID=A0ABR7T7F0_HELCL|nr:hypothetical protein [Heliobacterium chlorum]MBC9786688.1 hypothetical protein [Heliobacterium chlorum]
MRYKTLMQEKKMKFEMQKGLIRYIFLVFAGMLTYLATYDKTNAMPPIFQKYFLLLTPISFYVVAWSYYDHDKIVIYIAKYVTTVIRPKIEQLLNNEISTLQWEHFMQETRKKEKKELGFFGWPIFRGNEHILALLGAVVLIIMYMLYYLSQDLDNITSIDSIEPILSILLFVSDLLLLYYTEEFGRKIKTKYDEIINENDQSTK